MEKIELIEERFTTEASTNFHIYYKSLEDFYEDYHISEPLQQKTLDFIDKSIIEWLQKKNLSIIDTEDLNNILDIFGKPSELLQLLGVIFQCPKCSTINAINTINCRKCSIKFEYDLNNENDSLKDRIAFNDPYIQKLFFIGLFSSIIPYSLFIDPKFTLTTGKFLISLSTIYIVAFSFYSWQKFRYLIFLYVKEIRIRMIPHILDIDSKILILTILTSFILSFWLNSLKLLFQISNFAFYIDFITLFSLFTCFLFIIVYYTRPIIHLSSITSLNYMKKLREINNQPLFRLSVFKLKILTFFSLFSSLIYYNKT